MFQAAPPPIIRSSKTVHTATDICQAVTATFRYRAVADFIVSFKSYQVSRKNGSVESLSSEVTRKGFQSEC
jgi:hypothetical protein